MVHASVARRNAPLSTVQKSVSQQALLDASADSSGWRSACALPSGYDGAKLACWLARPSRLQLVPTYRILQWIAKTYVLT